MVGAGVSEQMNQAWPCGSWGWVDGRHYIILSENILVCSAKTQAALLLKTLINASKAHRVLVFWEDF